MENAKFTLREFPILEKIVDNEEVSAKKRIIDAIYIVNTTLLGKIFHKKVISHNDTLIIYDYKTGEVKNDDFLQLESYAGIIRKLLKQSSFKKALPQNMDLNPQNIMCILDYSYGKEGEANLPPQNTPEGWDFKQDNNESKLYFKGLSNK